MRKLVIIALLVGFGVTAMPNNTMKSNNVQLLQEKQYKKIEVSEVAPEAMEKIKKGYGQYTIKEAYRAEDGEYKLVLTKDGVDLTATFTSGGDLIKIIA